MSEKMRMELTFSKRDSDLWYFINNHEYKKSIVVKMAVRHFMDCNINNRNIDIDNKIKLAVQEALNDHKLNTEISEVSLQVGSKETLKTQLPDPSNPSPFGMKF